MITLSVALSEACNLNCTYCNVDKQSKTSIDPILFLQEFNKIRTQNPKEKIQIDFFGGEPLLHFNKIKYILETINDTNVQYVMPTNGLLLDQEKLNYLIKHNVRISLSFDGLWQDINRPQHNTKGTFDIFIDKKDFFNQLNLSIHCMIAPGNYNILENHLFLLNYGANAEIAIIKDINVWDNSSIEKLINSFEELFLYYEADTTRLFPASFMYYLRHVLINKSKHIEIKSCGASENYFSFSENKLIACNRFKDEPQIEEKIPEFLNMEKCQTCEVKGYCRRGCLYENIKNDGPIDEICIFFKYIYNRIDKMLITLKDDNNFKKIIRSEIEREFGYSSK